MTRENRASFGPTLRQMNGTPGGNPPMPKLFLACLSSISFDACSKVAIADFTLVHASPMNCGPENKAIHSHYGRLLELLKGVNCLSDRFKLAKNSMRLSICGRFSTRIRMAARASTMYPVML